MEQVKAFLATAGIPVERVLNVLLAGPVILFFCTILIFWMSTKRRAILRQRLAMARGIAAVARRRALGLTHDEIMARLRPAADEEKGTRGLLLQVSEILLKLAKFDKAKTAKSLLRAGDRSPNAMSRYIIQRGMGMMIAPAVLYAIVPSLGVDGMLQVLVSLMGILVGGIIIDVRLDKRVKSRKDRLKIELPVLLDLLTIYLEAGSAFDVALARSSNALGVSFPVASEEIMHLRRDLELSIDRERILRDFADRIDTQTARTFISIVVQSERRGNAIAPALRRLARDSRVEVMGDVERKAQKIPTMIQLPMFVFILPAIFVSVIGPAVVMVMKQFGGT